MKRREVQSGHRKRDRDVFMVSLCRLQHIVSLLSQLNEPLKSTNLISFFKSQEALVIDLTHPAALQKKKKRKKAVFATLSFIFFSFHSSWYTGRDRCSDRFHRGLLSVFLSFSLWQRLTCSPSPLAALDGWVDTSRLSHTLTNIRPWGGVCSGRGECVCVFLLALWAPTVLIQGVSQTPQNTDQGTFSHSLWLLWWLEEWREVRWQSAEL